MFPDVALTRQNCRVNTLFGQVKNCVYKALVEVQFGNRTQSQGIESAPTGSPGRQNVPSVSIESDLNSDSESKSASLLPSPSDRVRAHLKKEPTHRRVFKRKHEESNSKATEQTLAIGEVVEKPENGDQEDDGNILAAGPSNVTQKLGFLESSEPSNICNLRVRRSPVYFGDFKISDLNNVKRRKRFWKTAHETVHKYKKINKYNQCKIRRQRNKIKSLNSLVYELHKEKRISAAQSIVLKVDI
ncbi:unnamed protein product [Acanthoscelides obtectus]|uniref:Uncharacterized protein n=1 Tax=Acanthoscelides obtectus TaxID=200917 RepID=A0A9P0KUK9_ACAOB|nr:unnamed protein product [Acanthoscelides obtectus]CAK1656180.1 hypothetical protein AOBTE_LOCUS19605 [Acanthoscelides obtectus]